MSAIDRHGLILRGTHSILRYWTSCSYLKIKPLKPSQREPVRLQEKELFFRNNWKNKKKFVYLPTNKLMNHGYSSKSHI